MFLFHFNKFYLYSERVKDLNFNWLNYLSEVNNLTFNHYKYKDKNLEIQIKKEFNIIMQDIIKSYNFKNKKNFQLNLHYEIKNYVIYIYNGVHLIYLKEIKWSNFRAYEEHFLKNNLEASSLLFFLDLDIFIQSFDIYLSLFYIEKNFSDFFYINYMEDQNIFIINYKNFILEIQKDFLILNNLPKLINILFVYKQYLGNNFKVKYYNISKDFDYIEVENDFKFIISNYKDNASYLDNYLKKIKEYGEQILKIKNINLKNQFINYDDYFFLYNLKFYLNEKNINYEILNVKIVSIKYKIINEDLIYKTIHIFKNAAIDLCLNCKDFEEKIIHFILNSNDIDYHTKISLINHLENQNIIIFIKNLIQPKDYFRNLENDVFRKGYWQKDKQVVGFLYYRIKSEKAFKKIPLLSIQFGIQTIDIEQIIQYCKDKLILNY
jgi:hypothetical protein